MHVVVVGGGPAGLYAALLLKKNVPAHHVTVLERNRAGDTFGWGVVFSDQTLDNFRVADRPSYDAITANFAHWDDIDVVVGDERITSSGHGFCGIARVRLLDLLSQRARDLGVDVRFACELDTHAPLAPQLTALGLGDPDLIIAADGVNSGIRTQYAHAFHPTLDVRTARFTWLGTTFPFDAFTFYFTETPHGVFQAHCYRFDDTTSTFIVECDEASWRAAGFDTMDAEQTVAACEALFADRLQGHRLLFNAAHRTRSPWTTFTRVSNACWHHENIVLIGDAAHTAHFSIGSGTKLAMEDAIALVRHVAPVRDRRELTPALARYQEERGTEALRLQNAARNSMEWFEHVKRYIHLPPQQFAYSLLTRSQRVSHDSLRLRDARYLRDVERWFASYAQQNPDAPAVPPMFTPYRLRGLTLSNRVVVSPMDMYSAVDGTPNDFHLVHLGARALGGAGLVVTEMTCVSPEGRITPGCTGMYRDEHVAAWRRVTEFVRSSSDAKMCLQLGHSGRKGSTCLPWAGGDTTPLPDGNWPVMAPSPIPYTPAMQTPRAMTRDDMDEVCAAFTRATTMAVDAGFDMVELHCAHGYLFSSFLTPVSNHRTDEFGGSLENRLRFPLRVFSSMRAIWPADRPMSVRISATDWTDDGLSDDDAIAIAQAFVHAGADIIHVSTGQTTPDAKPVYGRLYQTPFSDRIRNEGHVPTIAVGNVTEPDQVNSIIAAGRADLCALGRPHLSDPNWTLHAAAQLGYRGIAWPHQYYLGRVQLEREWERKGVSAEASL